MKFEELEPEVQDKVREWQTDDDWWDHIYEDAVRMGAILGITIYNRVTKSVRGKPLDEPDIYFDLGRGGEVTFGGNLRYRAEAVDEIKQETNDEVLIALAARIATIFVTIRMKGMPTPLVELKHDRTDIGWADWWEDTAAIDADIKRIVHDFKIWIWNNLDNEYNYLQSDECLSEYDYEEDGTRV